MKLKIEITCDNAAFGEDGDGRMEQEIARILREASDKLAMGVQLPLTLRDYNGNKVGMAAYVKD